MKVTAQEIITNLTKGFDISRELLADKMGVSTRTIIRWQQGDTDPSPTELKFLTRIYQGYKSTKQKRGKQ